MSTQPKNSLLDEIFDDIEAIKNNEKLYQTDNFNLRSQAIDDIDFHIIDRLETLPDNGAQTLKQHAESVKLGLEAVDAQMFKQLREKISGGKLNTELLIRLFSEYFDNDLYSFIEHNKSGYDNLDIFFNGLLAGQNLPIETKAREPEMVFYQKTPARLILALIERAGFTPHDVFYDLGSGLGQVSILVNLLTGVTATGVEFEPAFCDYAKTCARAINLTDVHFINLDARNADYSTGTVFFMYTPFEGKIMQAVLKKLSVEAKSRIIKVFTYGPCTIEVSKQNWLIQTSGDCPADFGEFISV
jgi:hypothetical protein